MPRAARAHGRRAAASTERRTACSGPSGRCSRSASTWTRRRSPRRSGSPRRAPRTTPTRGPPRRPVRGSSRRPAARTRDRRERTRPPLPGTAPPERREATPAEDPPTDIEPLVTGRRTLVGRARAGPQPLDLSRALRPFKRRWPDGRKLQLDIEETVRSYARTWKLVPKFRPAPERWFEVDIVIDDSPSMTVWGDMVSVLSALLRQLGAFRTIRTWRISVTGPVPRLHNEGGRPAALASSARPAAGASSSSSPTAPRPAGSGPRHGRWSGTGPGPRRPR